MAVLLFIMFAVLVWVAIKPRSIIWLSWLVICVYPHEYWKAINPLPMNVGYDDLFMVFSALIVLLRVNAASGRPITFSWPLKMAVAFLLIVLVSSAAGYLYFRLTGLVWAAIHDVLKTLGWVLFVYCLCMLIETERDVTALISGISVGLICSAVIIILAGYFPTVNAMFVPRSDLAARTGLVAQREGGAIGNANVAAVVLASMMTLLLARARMGRRSVAWFWPAGVVVMLVAAILTQSRTGLVALVLWVVGLLLFRGNRKIGVFTMAMVVVALVAMPTLMTPLFERVTGSYGTFGFASEVMSRPVIWQAYLSTLTPIPLILGQGETAAYWRAGANLGEGVLQLPHSVYLDIICEYGLAGVTWSILWLLGTIRRARWLVGSGDPALAALGRSFSLYLLITAICWSTLDLRLDSLTFVLTLVWPVVLDKAVAAAEARMWQLEPSAVSAPPVVIPAVY